MSFDNHLNSFINSLFSFCILSNVSFFISICFISFLFHVFSFILLSSQQIYILFFSKFLFTSFSISISSITFYNFFSHSLFFFFIYFIISNCSFSFCSFSKFISFSFFRSITKRQKSSFLRWILSRASFKRKS